MNTVRRFTNPDNSPRYEVTDDWGCAAFLTPQEAADYITQYHPSEQYDWDTRIIYYPKNKDHCPPHENQNAE